MLRIHEIKLKLGADIQTIPQEIEKKLGIKELVLGNWKIVKESLDARDKGDIRTVYSVDFDVERWGKRVPASEEERRLLSEELLEKCQKAKLATAPDLSYHYMISPQAPPVRISKSPVVVGFGPCGMFAALLLAQMNLNPVVIERGAEMGKRAAAVERFWKEGVLDEASNVQFGEGGAGTFSDGKLTTQIKDPRTRKVLEELVRAGGDESLLYRQKPHIGTDVLRDVVVNIREEIKRLGGQVCFDSQMTGLIIDQGRVAGVEINGTKSLMSEHVVLALGHSARDTMEMLYETGIKMEQKPFSMGVRIEHLQQSVNEAQYGKGYRSYCDENGPLLSAADYKLAWHCKNGRGVYTFCMCPGGRVIAAASEEGGVVTNGMSYHDRDLENANSGLLVDVRPEDYESSHPLAGMYFQRKYERLAFELGGRNYHAPAQRVKSFLRKDRDMASKGKSVDVKPSYVPGVTWTDISGCLPDFVTESLREALPQLAKKLRGFDDPEAVLTAVESRSSSPVRIQRDELLESSIKGLYPGGEGAGYAGGITSAAVDGIRIAERIAKNVLQSTVLAE